MKKETIEVVKPKYYIYPGMKGVNKEVVLKNMQLSNEFIIKKVCQYYNVPIDRVMSNRKFREIAVPRQVAQFFMRKYTDQSLLEIGVVFDRDHTTVIHSITLVQNLIDTDTLKSDVDNIEELFFDGDLE